MSKQKLAALLILSGSWLVALGCSLLPNLLSNITWATLFPTTGG
jgi:hypothetical protein